MKQNYKISVIWTRLGLCLALVFIFLFLRHQTENGFAEISLPGARTPVDKELLSVHLELVKQDLILAALAGFGAALCLVALIKSIVSEKWKMGHPLA